MAKKKTAKEKRPSSNVTRERLEGTPFTAASEYNAAKDRILKDEWEQLEHARARKELLEREEYEYIINRFKKGLSCEFGDSNNKLFRIYIDNDRATQVVLDERVKSEANNEVFNWRFN